MAENNQLPGRRNVSQQGGYILAQGPVKHCHLIPLRHTPKLPNYGKNDPQATSKRIQVPVSANAAWNPQKALAPTLVFPVSGWSSAQRDRGKAKLLPIGESMKDTPSKLTLHWPTCLCHLFSRRKGTLTSSCKLHVAVALPSSGSGSIPGSSSLSSLQTLHLVTSLGFLQLICRHGNNEWTRPTPSQF